MATTGSINGTNLLVYAESSAIAGSKSCKFDFTHDTRDTTVKSDAGWETKAEGKRSWKMSTEGLVILPGSGCTNTLLRGYATARTKVQLKWSTDTSGDKYLYGDAYVASVSEDAGDNASVTFSVSFDGTGTITEVTKT